MFPLYKKTSDSWLNEIKETIQWIENHTKTLTAFVIFLSSISFYFYTTEEGIPISITGLNFLILAYPMFIFVAGTALQHKIDICKLNRKSRLLFFCFLIPQ